MNSTITKLYDYKQAAIPEALLRWRIPDEEITKQLETLSRNHAFDQDVDRVQPGDSVACQGSSTSEKWNRPVLLFYPGRGLCDPALENACVGAEVGASKIVQTPDGAVELTVKRIVRRYNMPVGDELVQAENIPGVKTVADYCCWYRGSNEPERRDQAASRIANFLLKEIQTHSMIHLDPDEKNEWLWSMVNNLYQSMLESGSDPRIPEEGFDFLTEEEAKAKMFKERENLFTRYVVYAYMAQTLSGQTLDEICQEGVKKFAAEQGLTPEYIWENSARTTIYWKFISDRAFELLGDYAKRYLEA